ncbi:MAG: hypothetical protein HPY52_10405 [Firmicutes bacterium]|nr:hypothetical protein [Bacillota bacterium]
MSLANELRSTSVKPSHEYGPTAFWFINNDMNPGDLSWSLQEQREKGFAGVFMHPRTGLEVEYLSGAFWEGIRHAIKEASRLGMKAWMYDEYNWPSGPVGGRLLREHPEYREVFLDYRVYRVGAGETLRASLPEGTHPLAATAISAFPPARVTATGVAHDQLGPLGQYEPHDEDKPHSEGQTVISGVVDLAGYIDLTGYIGPDNTLTWTAPGRVRTAPEQAQAAWDVVVFFTGTSDDQFFCTANAPWTRAERGYLDLMNPEAVSKFLELTHEEYAKRFGEHFGKTIPGVFTDEPGHYKGMPWTGRFLDEFRRRKGYDLRPHLYKLALPAGDYVRIRCDYHEVATSLYIEAFYRQVRLWCEEHGLELTGHPIWEEDLFLMPVAHGSIASVWREMHMPGIDYLGDAGPYDKSNAYETKNLAPKLLASLAHQLGKKRILCEIFGGNGWATDLAGYKKVVNWALATGIDFFNPHAVHVSLKGLRKRDFPASHFVQQPWWEHYERLSSYIARGSYINTHTEHVADIAVLFPTFTLWAEHTLHDKAPFMRQVKRAIIDLADALPRIQRDYDFIFDEMLLEAFSSGDGGDPSHPEAGQLDQVARDFVVRVKVDPGAKVDPAGAGTGTGGGTGTGTGAGTGVDKGTGVAGPALVVGKESFHAVIIPPASTISRETARLLREFYDAGGTVIAIGAVPVNSPRQALDPEVVEAMRGIFGFEAAAATGEGAGVGGSMRAANPDAHDSRGPRIRQGAGGGKAVWIPLPVLPQGSGDYAGHAGKGCADVAADVGGFRAWLKATLGDILGRFLPPDLVVENLATPGKPGAPGVNRDLNGDLMYSHRRAGDLDLYFVANLENCRQDVALRFGAGVKGASGQDLVTGNGGGSMIGDGSGSSHGSGPSPGHSHNNGHVEVWDPSSGEIFAVPAGRDGSIPFSFEPYEAFYFVLDRAGTGAAGRGQGQSQEQEQEQGNEASGHTPAEGRGAGAGVAGEPVVLRDEWDIRLEKPNMLLLEPWTVRVGGDDEDSRGQGQEDGSAETCEILVSRYESLEELAKSWHTGDESGVGESAHRKRHREMDYLLDEASMIPPGAYYTASAGFNLEDYPGEDLVLVYEDLGEPVRIEVNGQNITGEAEPIFVWDRCNRAIKLGVYVRQGFNEVKIRARMPAWPSQRPNKHGLEPVVLLGDFMVRVEDVGHGDAGPGDAGPQGAEPHEGTGPSESVGLYTGRTLVKTASSMRSGSWTENGLPNYVGAVLYRQRFVLPEAWFERWRGRRSDGREKGCGSDEHEKYELFLEFEDVKSTAEVTLNGHKLPPLIWPPYRVNISEAARVGENEVEIRVTNTIANLLATPRPAGILGAVKVVPYRKWDASI